MKNSIAWRRTALATLIAAQLCACTLVVDVFESDVDPGGEGIDAGSEDFVCEGWKVQPDDFDPCSFVEPTGSLDLRNGPWRYDTSTGVLRSPDGMESTPISELRTQAGADDIRVLSVTDLRIRESASLRAVGAHPLLILSFDEIDVEGQISVASTSDGAGAGANSTLCGTLAGQPGDSDDGLGGGGGGGSLRAEGGNGGDAITEHDSARGGTGGTGGVMLASFRGGCSGGIGGASAGGQPGAGGGGLLLMARKRVHVSGQISAGGQGGLATPAGGGGGGGGGSGGIIAINAEEVTVDSGGVVASNGGGGAEGSDNEPGRNGDDAQLSTQAAFGGNGGGDSQGDGGLGGAAAEPAGFNGEQGYSGAGGGGGGGSAGVVIISAKELNVASSAVMSPAFETP